MSFSSYDPNSASMMPSPNRGKRNPRFPSPRQNFSPRNQQNSFQNTNFNNRGYNRTPNRQSRGRGCHYGGYQRDVQQFSPSYRSMSGGYSGSSPNCSFDSNLKRRMYSGKGLYHPSMLNDPWEGLSSDDKPIFKAANYISENFLSYCAKLQTKAHENSVKDTGKTSSDDLSTSSVSQLAANVSRLYDSFVSSDSQKIQGNIPSEASESRPTKIQKTESTSRNEEIVAEKEVVAEEGEKGREEGNKEEFSDEDDGNIMF